MMNSEKDLDNAIQTTSNQLTEINTTADLIDSKTVISLEKSNKESLLKLTMKLTFSNFGLVLTVVIYACLGALMFQLLEQHEELRLCEEGKNKYMKELYDLKEDLFRYVLYNVTSIEISGLDDAQSLNNQSSEFLGNPEAVIDEKLRDFRNLIFFVENKYKYVGLNCTENSKWKFFSALLFSITIITTIGYGHVTPTTWV